MENAWNLSSILIFLLLCHAGWRSFRRHDAQKCLLIGIAILALPLVDHIIRK